MTLSILAELPEELQTTFNVYIAMLVFGGVFIVLSAVLASGLGHGDIGHGGDAGGAGHAGDSSDSGGHGGGFNFPQVTVWSPLIISFFIAFTAGVGAAVTYYYEVSAMYSAPCGVVGGAIGTMLVLYMINDIIGRMQGTSHIADADCVGAIATIITPVPENGLGEIRYELGGVLQTSPARSATSTAIERGAKVKILSVNSGNCVVQTES
ncbi:MAG: hypothetical protein NUW37_11940 [Planctomycetes bacterium]|nr:hypothetical protein [Planctomycetota bacterium]